MNGAHVAYTGWPALTSKYPTRPRGPSPSRPALLAAAARAGLRYRGGRLDFVGRMAAELLKRRGYTPVPATAFGGMGVGGGGAEDETPVDYLTYSRISNIVYACTRLRADAIASLPLRFYSLTPAAGDNRSGRRGLRAVKTGRTIDLSDPRVRRTLALPMGARVKRTGMRMVDAGEAVEVEAADMIDVLSHPSDAMTWRSLVYLTEFSLCLTGRARWLAVGRDEQAGKDKPPTGLRYVRHDRLAASRWAKAGDPLITGWTLDANTAGARPVPPGGVVEFRYPDPADPDYGALPPLAAARLGADSYTAAMKANRNIFNNGIKTPGFLGPIDDTDMWTDTQLSQVADALDRNARGEIHAHKLLALPIPAKFTPMTLTPRDAEFAALLDFAVEDCGRAYGVPLEMIGGNRATYNNREFASKDFWATCGSEAMYLAEELTECVVPMFGPDSGVDFVAFDLSGVSALQEDETQAWARAKDQIATGAIRVGEWRTDQGKDDLPNEPLDASKASVINSTLALMGQGIVTPESAIALISALGLGDKVAALIVGDGPPVIVPAPIMPVDDAPTDAPVTAPPAFAVEAANVATRASLAPEFGSDAHRDLWTRAIAPATALEADVKRAVVTLFEAHRDSILDKLGNADRAAGERGARVALDDLASLFGRAKWLRAYRESMRKVLRKPFEAGGAPVAGAFDAAPLAGDSPAAVRFLMGRSQRFAVQVNDTTWQALRSGLAQGIADGAGLSDLKAIVTTVMDGRIRSSAETIARTEVIGAFNGGSQLTALAIEADTGLRLVKTWITALDERVRDDHAAAHGQAVALTDDFSVGGASGPNPGDMGDAGQDINCRCVVTYDEESGGRGMLAALRPVETEA